MLGAKLGEVMSVWLRPTPMTAFWSTTRWWRCSKFQQFISFTMADSHYCLWPSIGRLQVASLLQILRKSRLKLMQFYSGLFDKCLLTHHGRPSLKLYPDRHRHSSFQVFQFQLSSSTYSASSCHGRLPESLFPNFWPIPYVVGHLNSIHESRSWWT